MSVKIKQCRYGPMMYLDNDKFIGRSLDVYGEANFHEIECYRQLIAPGDVVIDLGANIGSLTIPFAQAVGPSGRVYAIEAYSFTSYILGANVVLNDLHNVSVIHAVASDSAVFFYEKNEAFESVANFGSLRLSEEITDRLVPGIAVDDMGLTKVDLIKVDVEGMEPKALWGSLKTIQQCRPYLVVEYLLNHKDILEFLISLGYDCRISHPPLFNENNFAGKKENIFEGIKSMDLVCFPKERGVPTSPWFIDID